MYATSKTNNRVHLLVRTQLLDWQVNLLLDWLFTRGCDAGQPQSSITPVQVVRVLHMLATDPGITSLGLCSPTGAYLPLAGPHNAEKLAFIAKINSL